MKDPYALAFRLFFLGRSLAIYYVGRSLFNIWVGVLAALFLTFDFGAFRLGGWFYTVWIGVWPQAFSSIFSLLALVSLGKVLRTGSWRSISMLGLLTLLALLSHPIQIFQVGLMAALGGALICLCRSAPDFKAISRLGISILLGILGSSIYLLPFFTLREYAAREGGLDIVGL